MNVRTKRVGILLSVVLATARPGLGAQERSPENQALASLAAQRAAIAELILAAKERALGEPFEARLRASLRSRMEGLSMEQLEALAREGDSADIPSVLGSVTSDLVYTPVTPCRVFDSRVSQGGPGPIPANTQRNVVVSGTVGFPAQGGFAGGCGVPVGATSAIINFVTVLPAGPGNIRAWAVASPQPPAPLAAIINYGSVVGLPAIANGVSVPLCNPAATSCTLGDLRLQADTNGTDILGDVVGYFGPVNGVVTSVNSIAGPVTIAAGSNISVTPSGGTLTIANTAPVNPGTVTNVATGAGLTGGPISGSGTISVETGGITSAMIGAGQVVKGVNGLSDTMTIAGSGGTTVSTVGSTITVAAAPLPAGALIVRSSGDTTVIGAGYTESTLPFSQTWTATATAGAPAGRDSHTAVWTGSLMIVWGGWAAAGVQNTGGIYDPLTDSWAPMTTTNAPTARYSHTAVWTGSRMIVWGGLGGLTTGGLYDPLTDSWAPVTTTNAPAARYAHTAVWTGSQMIIWGGASLNTGGLYDPGTDSWIQTTTTNAPAGRYDHTAVWTGTKMIVWGGLDAAVTNTGGQYDPLTDSWAATNTAGVVARSQHRAVWTGSRMIVAGGSEGQVALGIYDPSADSWSIGGVLASARYWHTAVWTGSRMIVWGGTPQQNTGYIYDPSTDALAVVPPPAPELSLPGRQLHTAVWTGTKMIVWGGTSGLNSGAQWLGLYFYVKN